MRQGQQNRRNRGRGRNNRSNNPLTKNYESNGPEVKIKGSAAHIAEKYMALARDALSSGNTVTAENYFQHAEHYFRIIHAAQARQEENAAAAGGAQKSGGRNGERRARQSDDSREKAPVPGTGKQPAVLNGNTTDSAPVAEKPKRTPRPRRPKAARSEASKETKSEDKESNVTA